MTDRVSDPKPLPLTVLYDGGGPLCRREIGVYQGLQPNEPVCFTDVSDPSVALPSGTTREHLLARFHVRGSDGQLLSGAQAFLALWAALPGWPWSAVFLGQSGGWSGCISSFCAIGRCCSAGQPGWTGPARLADLA